MILEGRMRKPAFIALLLLVPFLLAAADAAAFPEYLRVFDAGSEEGAILDYAKAEILRLGGAAEERDFSEYSGGHSFSRILESRIEGDIPDTLIIAAPLGIGDRGFNAALILSLLADCLRKPPPVSLHFLFLGGDAGEESPLGSRLFLQEYFPESPAAVLYFNLGGLPERIIFQTGTRRIVTPSWILRRISRAAVNADMEFRILGSRNQNFRLGVAAAQSSAGEYLKAGYPTVALEGEGEPQAGQAAGWGGEFSVFFRNFLLENSAGFPEEWDQHYLFFRAGSRQFFVEEPEIVLLLLTVLGASFAYALIFRRYMIRYIRTFYRNLWNLPLIWFITALFLLTGTLFVQGLSMLRGTPGLWTHHPFLFFLLKTGSAAFLTALSFHNLRRLPISKNGSFYSAAAIFFFFINVLLFSFINLSYSYYFLFAYITAVAFSIFKNRLIKFLLILAAPLWLYILTYETFALPEMELADILINSPVKGNLLLSFMFLPFFLMLIRMDMLFRHPRKGKSGFGLKIVITLTGLLSAATAAYIVAFDPYRDYPQNVHVQEYVDATADIHELRLTSPSPLGEFGLQFGKGLYPVSTRKRNAVVRLEDVPVMFQRSVRSESFLDRRTYIILTSPLLKPEKIVFTAASSSDLVIYDSNFPPSLDISGRRAELFIGSDPPLPLEIILTLPGNLEISGELLYHSSLLSEEVSLKGKTVEISTSSTVRDTVILKDDG